MLQDLNYTYDALGQIKTITDSVNTATQTFRYDALNRLIWAQGSYGTKTYAYDEIGNITLKDGLTYTYAEPGSRLDGSAAGPHAVTSLSDGSKFQYDLNGNMAVLSKGLETTKYAYDIENRLVNIKTETLGQNPVNVADYEYDGDGGRTKKMVYQRDHALYNINTNLAVALYYNLDGSAFPATDAKPQKVVTYYIGNLYEFESAGTTGAPRATRFLYLGSQRAIAVSPTNTGDPGVLYYHNDHLGGTNVISDKAGDKRDLTEYDPFGLVTRHDRYGKDFNTIWAGFTGKHLDDESGLMYYGARYYNPKLGRFITADTIIGYPKDSQSFNRYSYCHNNPINNIDPSGHKKKHWWSVALSWLAGGVLFHDQVYQAFQGNWRPLVVSGIGLAVGFLTGGVGALSANLFINVGLHAAIGAAAGSVVGGVSSVIMGGTFAQGAASGAIGGAIGGAFQGVMTSQQFGNWKAGNGFRSNTDVAAENRVNNLSKQLNSDKLNVDKAFEQKDISQRMNNVYSSPTDKAAAAKAYVKITVTGAGGASTGVSPLNVARVDPILVTQGSLEVVSGLGFTTSGFLTAEATLGRSASLISFGAGMVGEGIYNIRAGLTNGVSYEESINSSINSGNPIVDWWLRASISN